MSGAADTQHDFLDRNGREVHTFASQMANLGLAHLTDLLVAMLKSGSWRRFKDGLGTYEFLPGEFDYFLTQQGIRREDVMNGVRDLETKALLEAAMDERRTGEEGYRRRITTIRAANPQRPGRPIWPFGWTEKEAKELARDTRDRVAGHREPLGRAVRTFVSSGGATTRRPNEQLPPVERLRRRALRLNDHDLATLLEALKQEQRRRRE